MRPRERGIALITAIVLVAIATVIATAIAFSSAMAARRATTVFGADQSLLAAEGAEAVAAYLLKQSMSSGTSAMTGQSGSSSGPAGSSSGGASVTGTAGTTTAANGSTTTAAQSNAANQITALNQLWARSYGPTQLMPGVVLESFQLEDQQGKFNINNLAPGPTGATDPVAVQQFGVLLSLLQIDTKWAGIVADWIDSDVEPNVPYGAEDSVYLSQTPQYRAANEPVSSISELLATGMGRDIYNRISPYITALPSGPGSAINVCTASGLLLDAISGSIEYSNDPNALSMQRQAEGCFPTLQVFQASLNPQTSSQLAGRLGQQSSYFRLVCFITIGTARFRLYSLLQRDLSGQVRVVLRTFGTE
jgi:general secretion pathway protein K